MLVNGELGAIVDSVLGGIVVGVLGAIVVGVLRVIVDGVLGVFVDGEVGVIVDGVCRVLVDGELVLGLGDLLLGDSEVGFERVLSSSCRSVVTSLALVSLLTGLAPCTYLRCLLSLLALPASSLQSLQLSSAPAALTTSFPTFSTFLSCGGNITALSSPVCLEREVGDRMESVLTSLR